MQSLVCKSIARESMLLSKVLIPAPMRMIKSTFKDKEQADEKVFFNKADGKF